MANITKKVEDYLLQDQHLIVGLRTSIGSGRWGRKAEDNRASFRIEIVDKEDRTESSDSIINRWESHIKTFEELKQVRFIRSRFGFSSGSPIEILVQDNDDSRREQVSNLLVEALKKLPDMKEAEAKAPIKERTYEIKIKRDLVSQLGIDSQSLAQTIRTYVHGVVLYTVVLGDEEIEIRLASNDDIRANIENVLRQTVANRSNYMVPIDEIVSVEEVSTPSSIERTNYRRTITVYGDLDENAKTTPLEVAEHLEEKVFPEVQTQFPETILSFEGEIKESRSSENDFLYAIAGTIVLIYAVLILTFKSFTTPILILLTIPFGAAGVILAFYLHDKTTYGFFGAVGIIGMCGVVINDSIVLVSALERAKKMAGDLNFSDVLSITTSRLRPVLVTTLTTVAGLFPTAYGVAGYDSMLSEMMFAMGWGLIFGTFITLVLVPSLYLFLNDLLKIKGGFKAS